jgi:hypothetical protein
VAAELRKEPDIEVEVIDGGHGEFSVLLDDQLIAEKGDAMPTVDEIVTAVKRAPFPVGV